MDATFRSLLPAWLAELVQESEAAIGFSIEVVVNDARPPDAPLRAMVNVSFARIDAPSRQRFLPSSVFHELLHIRRVLVDGVPRLRVADAVPDEQYSCQLEDAVTNEDNSIEHLVIVPMELERFPERREHWEQVVRGNLHRIAAGQEAPHNLDASALGLWMFVRHALPESPVEAELRETLAQRGLQQRADDAVAAVLRWLADKRELTRAWFTATGLDPKLVDFEFLDPNDQTTSYEPVAPPPAA
jgi:hypothetical protein